MIKLQLDTTATEKSLNHQIKASFFACVFNFPKVNLKSFVACQMHCLNTEP